MELIKFDYLLNSLSIKFVNVSSILLQTQRAEMTVLREEVRALHSNDLKQVMRQ